MKPRRRSAPTGFFIPAFRFWAFVTGHQVMAHMMGGRVTPADKREFGKTEIIVQKTRRFMTV
jgi:anthranilate/para-aminobenzoate synthase component II